MANDVIYTIKVIDQALSPLRKIGLGAVAMGISFGASGKAMRKFGYNLTSLRAIVSATYGDMLVMLPIKKAVEFEDKMMDIRRIVDDFKDPGKFAEFSDQLMKIGLYLGKAPADMAELGYEVAKFVSDRSSLTGYIELAGKVSRAFDIPEKEAGEQIGKITDKMGLNLKKMEGFLDAVNYAADRSSTSVKNQLQVISRVATNLKGIRLPPNLAAGWANFADRLKATPRTAAKGLEMFFRKFGQMRGGYRKLFAPGADPNKIMVEFLERLQKMPIVARKMRIDKIFKDARVSDFVNNMVERLDVLRNSLELVSLKGDAAGSMTRELEMKLSTARTAIDKIVVVLNMVAITIGGVFLPAIKELAPKIINMALGFRDFLQQHPMLVKIVMYSLMLLTALTSIGIVVGLISIAISALLSPVTLIVLAVLAIGAAFSYLYDTSEPFRNFIIGLKDLLLQAVDAFVYDIKAIYQFVMDLFAPIFKVIDFLSDSSGSAKTAANFGDTVAKKIDSSLSGASDFFAGVGSAVSNYVTSRMQDINLFGEINVIGDGVGFSKGSINTNAAGNVGLNMRSRRR